MLNEAFSTLLLSIFLPILFCYFNLKILINIAGHDSNIFRHLLILLRLDWIRLLLLDFRLGTVYQNIGYMNYFRITRNN